MKHILVTVFFGLLLLGNSAFAQPPIEGLVGYFPFKGNANDESGNGHEGIVHGAVLTIDRFGNENSAFLFNGIDNYIEIANSEDLNMFAGFSLVAWINFTSSFGSSIISKHINNYYNGFTLSACDNLINLTTNNSEYYLSTPETYNDGNWYLVAGTFDSTVLSIYVDGELKASREASYDIGNDMNIRIGSDSILSFFNGIIDDVHIYNRALSSDEIKNFYNSGNCFQTIYDTVHIVVYDTINVFREVRVSDTLIVDVLLTEVPPPDNIISVKIYPNPIKDKLIINLGSNYSELSDYKIKISNLAGEIVYNELITQSLVEINLSSWTGKGTYILEIHAGADTLIAVKKIILQ